ncbi:MAG TPA: prolipoprotein diacylglyceryl transferase family protein [Candidatus Limnocylindrales bacterium]|nr:prolipoprotein diacylglyceryl transferase family protein [Candidatus Limnocylindrales bacterium]
MPTLPLRPVIELAFDPVAVVGDWHVRLQTIALAVVIFLGLLVAARIARRTPINARQSPDAVDPRSGEPNHLRRDDLLYIAVAALPGAVLGGRLGWALVHVGYVTANAGSLLDISVGGFGLPLAVVGGTLTAALVGSLLDTPIPRWLHALILPVLFGIAGGKLAMVLGGDGQGVLWDGAWATAYLGPGPWLSLAPAVPSHPSQAYEALATVGVIVLLVVLRSAGLFRAPNGTLFLVGLAAWCLARVGVAFTWRDPAVLGALGMDQVLCLGIAAVSLVLLATGALVGRARARRGQAPGGGPRFAIDDEPDWPDPAARPRI